MYTIKYTLKSIPEITIEVLTSSANFAEPLIQNINLHPLRLKEILVGVFDYWDGIYPYLKSKRIIAAAMELPTDRQEWLRVEDEIYLRSCMYSNDLMLKISQGAEREKLSQIASNLERTIKELER